MTELEKKKLEAGIGMAKAQVLELEVRLLERREEIGRIEAHIQSQLTIIQNNEIKLKGEG